MFSNALALEDAVVGSVQNEIGGGNVAGNGQPGAEGVLVSRSW